MKRPVRVLIVDDERLARTGLRRQLEALEGLRVAGECASGVEAVRAIGETDPDLVLLDIQMPGMDAFEVIRRVGMDRMPAVVFVTAFDEYAIEAFEVDAVDYVLKPIDPDRFRSAIRRARSRLASEGRQEIEERLERLLARLEAATGGGGGGRPSRSGGLRRIAVRKAGRVVLLDAADVDWIESAGNYVRLHASGEKYLVRRTMKAMVRELDPGTFLRIHRSTLVNMERVSHLEPGGGERYVFVLEGGTRLESSRRRRGAIEAFLDREG